MCGIVGVVGSPAIKLEDVTKMCDTLSHRGPDDCGVRVWADHGVGLGHRRLSIIDLSISGRNPMANEDGTVWIVFNGEVYNFQSLRRELQRMGHRFHSHSDTEVVIHAYEQWGDDHVHRLRGMFAYAIYDRRPDAPFRLLLVRDRLGIKPLFYTTGDRPFLFASEIKALLRADVMDTRIDRSAVFDYLTYGYIPCPKTAYAGICKLPPGHLLVWRAKSIHVSKYWDVPLTPSPTVRSLDEAVEEIAVCLRDAVCAHMVSDVPVGVFLSGGMDSSAVTALMAQASSERVRTFSIGFDVAGHSETEYAQTVAQRHNTQHHTRVVSIDSMQTMLPRIAAMYDEPFADGSAIPTLRVSAVAREFVKVTLSGDGGDEVFAGYNWYSTCLRRKVLNSLPEGLRRSTATCLRWLWPRRLRGYQSLTDLSMSAFDQYARLLDLFTPQEKRRVLVPEWAKEFTDYDDHWYYRRYWQEDLDPLTRAQYLDLKTYLPDDILTKVDRASMAVSLEVRPPLLDHRLVEKVLTLPVGLRVPSGRMKYLLKQTVAHLLPEPILTRPKKGFNAPWMDWIMAERHWAEKLLKPIAAGQTDVLRDDAYCLPFVFESGKKVWALLVLQEWLKQKG